MKCSHIFRTDNHKGINDCISNITTKYLEIIPKDKIRTKKQNSYYWLCLGIITNSILKLYETSSDYDKEKYTFKNSQDLHEIMKTHFLGHETKFFMGMETNKVKSTTELTPEEFGILLEKVHITANYYNVTLPNLRGFDV